MSAQVPTFITLEEHFTSAAATKVYGSLAPEFGDGLVAKLSSLSDDRIKDMDSGMVARQILSHTPFKSDPSPELCAAINDELHAATKSHPSRLSGFATLPMLSPKAAAAELRRTVTELGFVGALIDAHTEGVFYDGPDWDVFWQTAEALNVPIYIHPCFASEQMLQVNYRGNYSENIARSLGASIFGWHAETG